MSNQAMSRCVRCGARIETDGECRGCLLALGLDAGVAVMEIDVEATSGSRPGIDDQNATILDTTLVPRPGLHVGPYRLIQEVGGGGMGVVWQAEQESPVRRMVALKLIRSGMDSADVVARFESERQALALMNHPGIAQVFDAGTTRTGRLYFVMEFVAGSPITDYCDRSRVGIDARLGLFAQVCEAVQHAHQKGIIHRDLKPSNVLVAMQDGAPAPKIIDFGVAKATSQRLIEKPLHTLMGTAIGTPIYMSPEQFDGGIDVDTRSDVYSLGVVLYELLTGQPALGNADQFTGLGFAEVRRRIVELEPVRPSASVRALRHDSSVTAARRIADGTALSRRLHGDLDWIVLKALEKDRTRRYASASELAADVTRHLRNEPITAGHPGRMYRARKFIRRNRVAVIGAAALVASLVLGTAGTAVGLVRARRAESEMRREAKAAGEITDFLVGIFQVSDPNETRGNTITARELLDRGAKDLESKLAGEPLVRGRLMATVGTIYRLLGLYTQSTSVLGSAVQTLEREAGADDPRTLDAKGKLASSLVLAGRLDEARALLSGLVTANERVYGADAAETARTLNTLAALHLQSKDYHAAIPVLERALAIREKTLGREHLDVSKVLNNLGHARTALGDLDGAERDFERALAIRVAALGEDHPETARILANLGMVASDRGDKVKAKARLERALAILERAFGPDHPDVVEVRSLLAEAGGAP